MPNDSEDVAAQLARWNKSADADYIDTVTDPNGRAADFTSDNVVPPVPNADGDPDTTADADGGEDYTGEEWDKQALKDEAESRGLAVSGSKEDLRARLVEDDQG